MVQWVGRRARLVLKAGFRSSPRCSKEPGSTPTPLQNPSQARSQQGINVLFLPHLTSIGASIISPPSQPQPPPNKESSSTVERSRKSREGCPGSSSWQQSQHRGQVYRSVISTSDNKCLYLIDLVQILVLLTSPRW